MAAGAAVGGVYIAIEVAKLLLPVVQRFIEDEMDDEGNPLTKEQIEALRAENDRLVQEVGNG